MLVGLVAAITALAYSLTQPKMYESSVTVIGTTAKPDEGLNNAIKGEVRRYGSTLTSSAFAQKIDERGKFDLGADAISGKLKPQPVPDNYLLKITVSDSDRLRAARLADAAADIIREDSLTKWAAVPEDSRVFFDKVSPAPIPDRPSTPRTNLNMGAGLAIGLVLGLILIFVLDFFDTSLKSEDDVELYTGLKVIGVVPPWRNNNAFRRPPAPVAAADSSAPLDETEIQNPIRRKQKQNDNR